MSHVDRLNPRIVEAALRQAILDLAMHEDRRAFVDLTAHLQYSRAVWHWSRRDRVRVTTHTGEVREGFLIRVSMGDLDVGPTLELGEGPMDPSPRVFTPREAVSIEMVTVAL